ncbi:pyridoxine/pyridoxamine 5'-phosphate oxidase [Jannaschia pagri]|uniref:Pyridoxine/pyridoxamine 5'-phosphate oxidase n=1 Tax=Jannaschia pagri TaxID=2829797 RepID=A0ABQ4NN08_9RHOB|nr:MULTISPECIES: pyridoxamine 5'-phosphate oxidase [unclassified Jannaschia]GIT91961.1 pyridoxine/pyridoxamine 5'-phosphate oxidase [Jannaschia sp. AI_61]GIT95795.1 pyridoxine/pyridoxamine 5'-phosphate oxidase [Jannaschia sp. AI_62]
MGQDRSGIFAGDDPFRLATDWLAEATKSEPEDPNAMAISTVDAEGLPNVRMVLLKDIEVTGGADGAFVFYTNFEGTKGQELAAHPKAAGVLHWKSLRRQLRFRGEVERVDDATADRYFASRSLNSRLGAWASRQSRPLNSRASLMAEVAKVTATKGPNPPRPSHWGGFRIRPVEIEFWADGAFRLHDRFRWTRAIPGQGEWTVERLNP